MKFMTWEEKFEALQALSKDISLKMRFPGNWYVSQTSVERKRGGFLGGGVGNGKTPQEAVEDDWKNKTELESGEYLVIDAYKPTRRAVEWNGFMWQDVKEDVKEEINK
jgi:hypothetical protein